MPNTISSIKTIHSTLASTIKLVVVLLCCFTAMGCDDETEPDHSNKTIDTLPKAVYTTQIIDLDNAMLNRLPDTLKDFVKYIIPKDEHFCIQNTPTKVAEDSLAFELFFDSTAKYKTVDNANQADINKLFGFSDCSSLHQVNSARFGWRYYKNNLELLAYCYDNKTRAFKSIGIIDTYKKHTCAIVAKGHQYIFYLNHFPVVTMPRGCTEGLQYRLFPYFGGDEAAPHDINIWIKKTH
jgi:hypothetical protein